MSGDSALGASGLAVLCRAAEALLRAQEWIWRRGTTVELFNQRFLARGVNLWPRSRNCKHGLSGCASILHAASYSRRRIPVRLSHAPTDSSTGFSYACGMSACSPALRERPAPAGARTKESRRTCLGMRLGDVCVVYRQKNEQGITPQITLMHHFHGGNYQRTDQPREHV